VACLAGLLDVVQDAFDLTECGEIMLEANPGTIDRAYLSEVRFLGIDRLSIGAQSARDTELSMLGRSHEWGDVKRVVDLARASGFERLSLDLLFGLPSQSLEDWSETLEAALELNPEHLSLPGLTIEEGTLLAQRITVRELAAPEEALAADMYELAEDVLANAGFFHYEISNWAKMDSGTPPWGYDWWPDDSASGHAPDKSEEISPYVCRHNLSYWPNKPWLGVGAGAHSWMPGRRSHPASGLSSRSPLGERWSNVGHPEAYVTQMGGVILSISAGTSG
jgi:oxygen-independent coproporphyrinogen-3 oxidase